MPVRPKAADQRCNPSRRRISASRPTRAATAKAASAASTQAPCRYTMRTFEPRDCSSGPNKASTAITNRVAMKNRRGDERLIMGRIVLERTVQGLWRLKAFCALFSFGAVTRKIATYSPQSGISICVVTLFVPECSKVRLLSSVVY